MEKLFKLTVNCANCTTYVRRITSKILSRVSDDLKKSALRSFSFALGEAEHQYKFVGIDKDVCLHTADVQFNSVRCQLCISHKLFGGYSVTVAFSFDEDFDRFCKDRMFLAESAEDTTEDTTDTTEDTTDTTEDTTDTTEDTTDTTEDTTKKCTVVLGFLDDIPVSCLSFKWCHAPFDTSKSCYNCAFNHSCDTAIKYSFTTDNFQIVPFWVYSKYNINPLTALIYALVKFLNRNEMYISPRIDDTFLSEELPF